MSKWRVVLAGGFLVAALAAAPVIAQSADAPVAVGPPQTISTPPRPGTGEDIVVEAHTKRATSPDGDPRSVGEIHEDQMAYDRCLVNAKEPDMSHPVDSTPEELCSRRLGMNDRHSIPNSVKQPKSN